MNRREFIGTLAAAAPAFALQPRALVPARRVVIIGAGLAGLSAALQLRDAGWTVDILEARTRPGGRVYTMREPFSDGLHAEAGAARVQDSHEFTLQYINRFNLTLDPFWPTEGQSVTVVAGQRLIGAQGAPVDLARVPFEFSDEERKIGLRGGLVKYLFAHMSELGDPSSPDWPAKDFSRFEVPISEFCRRNGASPAFVKMIAFGHDLEGMSTLQFLRDTVLGAKTRQWFKLRGGSDRLPYALASALSDHIHYGAPVVAIRQDDRGVDVIYRRAGETLAMRGDFLISTVPTPVLARVDVTPALPPRLRSALDELGGLPMARVHLQMNERFWLARGHTGWAATDDPMDVWDYTRDQPGRRGILGAYLSGRIAHAITRMSPEERVVDVLTRMERVHPGARAHFEAGASHSWISDPWARGAGVEFNPGQLTKHYAALRVPVGRIHFAGEHTSPWAGWMNGAIESGHRAAREIIARR